MQEMPMHLFALFQHTPSTDQTGKPVKQVSFNFNVHRNLYSP